MPRVVRISQHPPECSVARELRSSRFFAPVLSSCPPPLPTALPQFSPYFSSYYCAAPEANIPHARHTANRFLAGFLLASWQPRTRDALHRQPETSPTTWNLSFVVFRPLYLTARKYTRQRAEPASSRKRAGGIVEQETDVEREFGRTTSNSIAKVPTRYMLRHCGIHGVIFNGLLLSFYSMFTMATWILCPRLFRFSLIHCWELCR